MPNVISFADAISATKGSDRALLIGNGFSAEYFRYETLLEESGLEDGKPLRALFEALNTADFEAVVRSLEDAAIVEKAYGHHDRARELVSAAQEVREALVRAVNSTHPSHRDELAFKYESAAAFLKHFATVFSLNYDLLLYWVNLETCGLSDGFGLGSTLPDGRFRGPFTEEAYCHIFNLHGGLHLFTDDEGEIFKALHTNDGVVATISETITKGRLPLYVAEGTSQSKMRKINSVRYLRHCYSMLKQNAAPIFVFGHSADANDDHIYKAVFSSEAKHFYFGVYKVTEEGLRHLDGALARHQKIGGARVEYSFFDAESAHVWDGAA